MKTPTRADGAGHIVFVLALILSGCSGMFGSSTAAEHDADKKVGSETTEVPVDKLETSKSAAEQGNAIEVIWEIPKEPVDGFVLHYGSERADLKSEVKLNSAEIEKFEDPQHGPVYRYVLENVPTDQSVFVSIAAFRGKEVSPPSDVFEIKPSL